MFLSFDNQEARRAFGGSRFAELAYCKLKPGASIRKILSSRSIPNWQNDGLFIYLDDLECFYSEYAEIFGDGIYNNHKSGRMDLFGINYYPPIRLKEIIRKIEDRKPLDYAVVSEWLKKGVSFNGFYVLGI